MELSIHSGKTAENPLSPSDLNVLAQQTLENHISRVWLVGEVTDYYLTPSGHSYFTLKDAKSSIKCTFFKQFNMGKKRYSNGDQLLVMGLATLYPERGTFQLKVERARDSGKGSLAQEFEKLKAKLESMGYFSAENKKPLPTVIDDLAIVTSKSSAAIRDVLDVIRRRNPLLKITIYNTSVQGEQAVGEIIDALHRADIGKHDAVLLTRGGGSEEDLWVFNDVSIAQTLFNMSTPCVSAIGHEKDTSISDWVADEFAITPSAAAERLTPDLTSIKQKIKHQQVLLFRMMQQRLQFLSQSLDLSHSQLEKSHPKIQWRQQQAQLKSLQHRLQTAIKAQTRRFAFQIQAAETVLLSQNLQLEQKQNHISHLFGQMQFFVHEKMSQNNYELQHLAGKLHALSPLATLSRGYSITKNAEHKVVENVNQINLGDTLITQLKQGEIHSKVTQKTEK